MRCKTHHLAALLLLAGTGMAEAQQGMSLTPETRAKVMEAGRICKPDIDRLCAGIKPGGGRILQCLQEHRADLKPDCLAAMQAIAAP